MKYRGISKNSSRYVFTLYLLIAILLNILLIVIAVTIDITFDVKYKIAMNLLFLTFTIGIYIWTFLVSNILIKNYRYVVTHNKIETVKGAFIVSRKIMLVSRVYKIEIKRGIVGRIFKVASIKFFSSGGSVKLNYIDYDKVDIIEENIRKALDNIYGK